MKKTIITLVTCLLVLASSAIVFAEGESKGIEGDWKIVSEMGGSKMSNVLTISKKDEGGLNIVWNMGTQDDEISNVKYENNKLTFTRTVYFGDFEMDTDFEGTLKDDKLTGQLVSERGDIPFTGTRIVPKPDAVGVWLMTMGEGDRQRTSELTITVNDKNDLVGKWVTGRGESKLSNIKFDKDKLTFEAVRDFNDQEFRMSFSGQVKGDELTGTFSSERGDRPAIAKRKGTDVIGRWDLVSQTERGEFNSSLIVDKDLTATYSMGFGNVDVNDLKIEDGKVNFNVGFGFGDRGFTIKFDLKIDGNTIKGTSTSDMGTSDVTGKKVVPPKLQENKDEAVKED